MHTCAILMLTFIQSTFHYRRRAIVIGFIIAVVTMCYVQSKRLHIYSRFISIGTRDSQKLAPSEGLLNAIRNIMFTLNTEKLGMASSIKQFSLKGQPFHLKYCCECCCCCFLSIVILTHIQHGTTKF